MILQLRCLNKTHRIQVDVARCVLYVLDHYHDYERWAALEELGNNKKPACWEGVYRLYRSFAPSGFMLPTTSINTFRSSSAKLSRVIRYYVNAVGSPHPIFVVPGDQKPITSGKGYHHTNKRGDIIHHPGAYRKAWGKPIYVPSSLRIEVGEQWLLQRGLAFPDEVTVPHPSQKQVDFRMGNCFLGTAQLINTEASSPSHARINHEIQPAVPLR